MIRDLYYLATVQPPSKVEVAAARLVFVNPAASPIERREARAIIERATYCRYRSHVYDYLLAASWTVSAAVFVTLIVIAGK